MFTPINQLSNIYITVGLRRFREAVMKWFSFTTCFCSILFLCRKRSPVTMGPASLGAMRKAFPPSQTWRQEAFQWVMTSDSETRQLAFRSPDGCGAVTFRMTLFLIENRASLLGKNRIWRSVTLLCLPSSALMPRCLWVSEKGINLISSQRDLGLKEELKYP